MISCLGRLAPVFELFAGESGGMFLFIQDLNLDDMVEPKFIYLSSKA